MAPSGDGIVKGTNGNDLIGTAYTGDPEGDRIDNNDGTNGMTGNEDLVLAGAGDDIVNAGDGDDVVWGGEGRDTINGGDGNDVLMGDGGDFADSGSGSGSGRLPLKRLRTLRVMVVSDAPAVDDTEKVTRCSPLSGGQVALNAVAHCASDGFSALGGEVPFQ